MEADLEIFIRKKQNVLGGKIESRLADIDQLTKDQNLILKWMTDSLFLSTTEFSEIWTFCTLLLFRLHFVIVDLNQLAETTLWCYLNWNPVSCCITVAKKLATVNNRYFPQNLGCLDKSVTWLMIQYEWILIFIPS